MVVSLSTPLEVVVSLATSLVLSPCHGAVDDVVMQGCPQCSQGVGFVAYSMLVCPLEEEGSLQ